MQGRAEKIVPAVTTSGQGLFSSRDRSNSMPRSAIVSGSLNAVAALSGGIAAGSGMVVMGDVVFPPFMIIGGLFRQAFFNDSEGLAEASFKVFEMMVQIFYTAAAVSLTSGAAAYVTDYLCPEEAIEEEDADEEASSEVEMATAEDYEESEQSEQEENRSPSPRR